MIEVIILTLCISNVLIVTIIALAVMSIIEKLKKER